MLPTTMTFYQTSNVLKCGDGKNICNLKTLQHRIENNTFRRKKWVIDGAYLRACDARDIVGMVLGGKHVEGV